MNKVVRPLRITISGDGAILATVIKTVTREVGVKPGSM
jgi:hypothetical protein